MNHKESFLCLTPIEDVMVRSQRVGYMLAFINRRDACLSEYLRYHFSPCPRGADPRLVATHYRAKLPIHVGIDLIQKAAGSLALFPGVLLTHDTLPVFTSNWQHFFLALVSMVQSGAENNIFPFPPLQLAKDVTQVVLPGSGAPVATLIAAHYANAPTHDPPMLSIRQMLHDIRSRRKDAFNVKRLPCAGLPILAPKTEELLFNGNTTSALLCSLTAYYIADLRAIVVADAAHADEAVRIASAAGAVVFGKSLHLIDMTPEAVQLVIYIGEKKHKHAPSGPHLKMLKVWFEPSTAGIPSVPIIVTPYRSAPEEVLSGLIHELAHHYLHRTQLVEQQARPEFAAQLAKTKDWSRTWNTIWHEWMKIGKQLPVKMHFRPAYTTVTEKYAQSKQLWQEHVSSQRREQQDLIDSWQQFYDDALHDMRSDVTPQRSRPRLSSPERQYIGHLTAYGNIHLVSSTYFPQDEWFTTLVEAMSGFAISHFLNTNRRPAADYTYVRPFGSARDIRELPAAVNAGMGGDVPVFRELEKTFDLIASTVYAIDSSSSVESDIATGISIEQLDVLEHDPWCKTQMQWITNPQQRMEQCTAVLQNAAKEEDRALARQKKRQESQPAWFLTWLPSFMKAYSEGQYAFLLALGIVAGTGATVHAFRAATTPSVAASR